MESQADCRYKMIFSDIDGTLLNSRHQVTPDTRREILRLEKEGIPFVLVSARMPEGMVTIRDQIGNRAPMVCYSGGLVLDKNGTVLYSRLLKLETALEIKEILDREFPDICCNTYGFSRWIVDDDQSPWVRNEERITTLKAEEGKLKSVFEKEGGIHKFLLMGEAKVILKLEEKLKSAYPNLSAAKSTPNYLEVMDGEVSKSAGVGFLCDYYGISIKEAIAFGDGHNDMDMLQAVGNSYAMANAPKEVQNSADHVTLDNDHEGLLAALKENFPQRS